MCYDSHWQSYYAIMAFVIIRRVGVHQRVYRSRLVNDDVLISSHYRETDVKAEQSKLLYVSAW